MVFLCYTATTFYFMKKIYKKILLFARAAMLFLALYAQNFAYAVNYVTNLSVTLSTSVISTADNLTITFTIPSGMSIPSGGHVVYTIPSQFTVQSGLDYTDVDLTFAGAVKGVAAIAADATYGVSRSGNVITVTVPANGALLATGGDKDLILAVGTNATNEVAGDKQFINPSSAGTYVLEVSADSASPGGDLGVTDVNMTINNAAPDLTVLSYIGVIGFGSWFVYKKFGTTEHTC